MSIRLAVPLAMFVLALGGLSYALLAPTGDANHDDPPVPTSKSPDTKSKEDPLIVDAPATSPPGMVWIPGGTFIMGDSEGAPDKNPDHLKDIPEHRDAMLEHAVELDGYWMDKTPVTNAQFKAFADATGYVTTAEKNRDRKDFAELVDDVSLIKEEDLLAGSICFNSNFDRAALKGLDRQNPQWVYAAQLWKSVQGADWREPQGPDSSIDDLMDHPVVHVAWGDSVAYCKWAGKRLPSEAEWEYGARGGLQQKNYPWGDEFKPNGKWPHNIWQGEFPLENNAEDGYMATSPVGTFAPNGYGLLDMTGNVWEWCFDNYRPDYYAFSPRRNPRGPKKSFDPREPGPQFPKRVQRGGSFMCSDEYCIGYTVASRMAGDEIIGTFHTGFRCVVRAKDLNEFRKAPAQEKRTRAGF